MSKHISRMLPKVQERYIDQLRERIRSGEISFEAFLLFLDNPASVLGGVDELQLTWKIADLASPQERAAVLSYIARAIGDPPALEQARLNWQQAQRLQPDTMEEIGVATTWTLLAFNCPDEAFRVAEAIPVTQGRFKSLCHVFRRTDRPEHLAAIRQVIAQESGIPRVRMLTHLASVTHSADDLAAARRELLAQSANPAQDHPWLLASQIQAALKCGDVAGARKSLNSLTHHGARLFVQSRLIVATGDRCECQLIAQAQPSDSTRTNICCVDALLGAGVIDGALAFAPRHRDPSMRCLLLSRIAYHRSGTDRAFTEAQAEYRNMRSSPWIGAAMLHYAFALTRRGYRKEATKLAARIPQFHDRAKALLGIYFNKDRPTFTDPFTEEED